MSLCVSLHALLGLGRTWGRTSRVECVDLEREKGRRGGMRSEAGTVVWRCG